MATDPNTLLPSPEDNLARGRAALQAYLLANKGKATLEGAKAVGAQFGIVVNESSREAINWANRKDTDVRLIPFSVDVLAGTGEPVAVDLVSPEEAPPESDRGVLEAAYQGAADVFAREPSLGLDPEARQALSQLGPLGRVVLTPLGDIGAGALTTIQAGLEGATLGAGQLMENVGLLDLIESATGVQQSPESARNELMAILESEGLRAPMGYATPRPAPVTPIQQIARAPELPEAPVAPIRRVRVPFRLRPLTIGGGPRAAAAVPEAPVAPAPQVSAQPSGSLFRGQPEQFTDLQIVANTNAIDNILVGRGIFTTSDRDLAATYGPNIFEFERPNPSKVFDISNPSEKDLRKLLPERGFEDTFAQIKSAVDRGDTRTAEDIVFEVLAEKHLPEDVNWEEVKNGFTFERGITPDAIRDLVSKDIQDAGFDFLKHQGGIRAGGGDKLHEVFIALRDEALVPKTQSAASAASEVLTPIQRIAQAPELPPVRPTPRAAAAVPETPTVAITPERVAAAADVPPVSATQRAEDAFSLDVRTPAEETQVILAPAKQKEIMAYQADYAKLLAERGIAQPKGRTQSEWIQSHMQAETIPVEDLLPIMQRHNVNSLEDQLRAAGISRESLSRSGRDLNQASQLRRLLLRAAQENPALAEQLGVGADAIKEASSVYRRLLGIESALLTTQMKTIVRNLVGATPQMPAYTMIEELTDAAIREARNIGRAPEEKLLGPSLADPLYAFWDTVGGSIVDAARAGADASLSRATRGRVNVSRSARALRNERTIKELRDAFPNEYSKLFGRYASDQVSMGPSNTRVGRVLSGAERALDVAHIGTRTMDRWVKNTQFPILLDMELRRVGRSLDEVFDTGDFASIPEPILESAIRRMHKRVFEDRPEGPEWYNRASRSLIDLLNYTLRPAGMSPFPNFMVSFGKYVFEQNPAAIVRFASKAERKKIADGDARAIGKIAAGLAGTLAWSAYKNFDDGTDWFEFYSPEGEVIDVSAAAAPSLPSLWQAYLIHKYNTGRMNEVKWSKDIAKVVGASNMRAGFNGYMVDSGFANIVDAAQRGESDAQIKKMFGEYMAQRAGGWTLFFRNFRDIAADTGLQDTTLRTPETVGQSVMSNLPFGVEMYTGATGTEIPARFAPTRAGELQERDPLLGQLTGAFFRGERNPLEQQLMRLGVAPGSLSRASGISDTYDRLLTAEIGDIAEKQLLPFLDERAPLGETPEKQRLLLRDEYTKIRSAARDRVLRNYPIYRFATEYENLSRDEKRLADKKNMADPQRGRSVPEFVSEVESIDPAMPVVRKSGPARELDLAAVPSGAAYADGRTFTIRVKP